MQQFSENLALVKQTFTHVVMMNVGWYSSVHGIVYDIKNNPQQNQ